MIKFNIPDEKKKRVILNTDAKNEVDDQYAIIHALLTESFELHGIIPAHFGDKRTAYSMEESYNEVMLLLNMMEMSNSVRVEKGAANAMPDEKTPVDSAGARLIIEEAMKEDERCLYIAFLGPLTDMASALLAEPGIADKNIKIIWIGGRDWPDGGWEYNLSNDIAAANVIMKSGMELWQIPRNVYRMMPVTFAELYQRVYPYGEVGKYLVENLIKFNNEEIDRPEEYRALGDSPAVGVILYEDCGKWSLETAPEISENMNYIHTGKNGPIRVYKTIDSRFILEDLYSKLSMRFKAEL